MKDGLLRAVWVGGVLLGIAGGLTCTPARAEIVGWVDDSGHVTYTNMAPPKGAKVVDRIAEDPADTRPQVATGAAAQAQLQALNDRVRDLEQQLHQGSSAPAPWDQTAYAPPPPGPLAPRGCDSAYYDCDLWAGPPVYTLYTYARGVGYYRQHGEHRFHGGQGGRGGRDVHRASVVAPRGSFRPPAATGHSRR
jgi:hypothetical protein